MKMDWSDLLNRELALDKFIHCDIAIQQRRVPMPYSGITMELGVVLKVINHVNR
jgi:hypothetical protein